jgi:hypothetical protein
MFGRTRFVYEVAGLEVGTRVPGTFKERGRAACLPGLRGDGIYLGGKGARGGMGTR